MKHIGWAALATALLIASGPRGARAACPRTLTTTNPFLNLPCPADDPRWAEAFAHWDQRGDTEEVAKSLVLFEALTQAHPGEVEAWLWLGRARYLLGVRLRGDEQVAMMKKAAAAMDQALKLDPGNGYARYWRWSAMIFYHEFTDQDFAQIRAFGQKYEDLRELTVPDDDPMWPEAVKHWDARSRYEEGKTAIALFEKLERKYPRRIEPKLWLLRANYWMHYVEPTKEGKAKWCLKAMEWGRKAIAMEPRNPAANYLTAASLGMYSTHTGFYNMVRYAYEITQLLTVVMEEDPNYFYGGVSQYLALAIARAGSLVGKTLSLVGFSQELIIKNTTFACNYEPRYLRNFLALGEMYLVLGQKDLARKNLEIVIAGDPDALKNMEPENRVAQDLARELMAKNFQEFSVD
ncbi:MAG TPA: hypothetical protein VM658_20485 [bacterium]|nr:hypothetical protein [bacterium]